MQKLALPFALALVLAACGGNPEPPKPAAAPEAPKPAAPTPPPQPAAVSAEVANWDILQSQVLVGHWRSEENKARDVYRHPRETLAFFGLKPGMNVVEITPGGGWYTEILAPLLKGQGKLTAAIVDPATAASDGTKNYLDKSNAKYKESSPATPTATAKSACASSR